MSTRFLRYHDNYLKLIAEHYNVDLKGKHIGDLTKADFDAMPAEARRYAVGLRATYDAMLPRRPRHAAGHIDDCLAVRQPRLAPSAHRKGKSRALRAFYGKTLSRRIPITPAPFKTLIARILVAPRVSLSAGTRSAESAPSSR